MRVATKRKRTLPGSTPFLAIQPDMSLPSFVVGLSLKVVSLWSASLTRMEMVSALGFTSTSGLTSPSSALRVERGVGWGRVWAAG